MKTLFHSHNGNAWREFKTSPRYQYWRRRRLRLTKSYSQLKSHQKASLLGLCIIFVLLLRNLWFNSLDKMEEGRMNIKLLVNEPLCRIVSIETSSVVPSKPPICQYSICGPYSKLVTLSDSRAMIKLTKNATKCQDAIHCCAIAYSIPRRHRQEIRYPPDSCYPIKLSQEIQPSVYTEILETVCHDLCDNRRISNFHPLMPLTFKVESKIKYWSRIDPWKLEQDIHRVIFITLDHMSRSKAKKFLPKTVEEIEKSGFHDMKGYSMVETTSSGNFMASLTGLNRSELSHKCSFQNSGYFDGCPFIWKEFRDFDYITSYLDDSSFKNWIDLRKSPLSGMFGMGEFIAQPTDFYIPSSFIQDKMRLNQMDDQLFNSFASTSPTDFILEFSKKFNRKYSTYPFLSVLRLNPDYNALQRLDEKLVVFLKDLKQFQYNTFIIFASNIGQDSFENFDGQTFQHERPFLYISIPNSLKIYEHNLLLNKNRLTTVYDIHQTFHEILMNSCLILGFTWDECLFSTASKNKTGVALLYPISSVRNCEICQIPYSICPCTSIDSRILYDTTMRGRLN